MALRDYAPWRPPRIARRGHVECLLNFGEKFLGLARQVFFTPPERRDAAAIEAARGEMREQLRGLDVRAAKRKGEHLVGELSRADFTWIPFVEIVARAGVDVEAAGTPWLVGWRTRMRARSSYERSYPPRWRKK